MEYTTEDQVLPLLRLHEKTSVPVKIGVEKDGIYLSVGPRDWRWDRKTGELTDAGTSLDEI